MELSPDMLEKFRQTGIRLDREGRFWHEGATVEHRGLYNALLRWLDVLPDGRPILRLDERRYAYVDVDDAHLLVVSARVQASSIIIKLNDQSEEELAYHTLEVAGDDALYCQVRGGKLTARITTPAYYKIAEFIEEDDTGFALHFGQHRATIRRRSP